MWKISLGHSQASLTETFDDNGNGVRLERVREVESLFFTLVCLAVGCWHPILVVTQTFSTGHTQFIYPLSNLLWSRSLLTDIFLCSHFRVLHSIIGFASNYYLLWVCCNPIYFRAEFMSFYCEPMSLAWSDYRTSYRNCHKSVACQRITVISEAKLWPTKFEFSSVNDNGFSLMHVLRIVSLLTGSHEEDAEVGGDATTGNRKNGTKMTGVRHTHIYIYLMMGRMCDVCGG